MEFNYGGSASNSHLDTLERFQSKALRMLTNAPWFVPNAIIRNDLSVTTIRQEVKKKTLQHLPAEARCASQPPGNHPTPRATLQQKTQTALS